VNLDQVCITKDATIEIALQKLQDNKKRFLICFDDKNIVLGLITDGDIRRCFLEGLIISDSISKVINSNFEYLTANSTFDQVCEKFKSDKIDFLPIVDRDMELKNIITKKRLFSA